MSFRASKCSFHPSNTLDFYCETCRTLACTACVLSSAHRAHSPEVIDALEVLPTHKSKLEEYVNQANGCLQSAENMMDNTASSLQTLQDNYKRAEAKIQKYFYRMRTILTDRERHFCSLLNKNISEKRRDFAEQRNILKASLNSLIECMKALGELQNRSDSDVLILRDEVTVIDKLNTNVDFINTKLESDDLSNFDSTVTMPCFEDYNFEIICRQVGDPDYRVCTRNCTNCNCANSQKTNSVENLSPALPVKKSSLVSKNSSDTEDVPPVPPRPTPGRKTKNGSFGSSSSFTPLSPTSSFISDTELTESGEMDVFNGGNTTPVKEDVPPPIPPKSPLHGKKKIPQWMEDYKKQLESEKKAINKERKVVESKEEEEEKNGIAPPPLPPKSPTIKNKMKSNSPTLEPKSTNTTINNNDYSPKPKPRTRKLTSLKENGVMADTKVTVQPPTPVSPPNSPIKSKPLPSLEITSKMMSSSMENDSIVPCGVCMGADNVIIVTDKSSNVRILKTTGKFLEIIAKDADINDPVAVATDGLGNIYIVDRASPPKILKFTKTGKFISKLISKTLRTSILGDPRGIQVTHDGHILVSDWEKSCVHIFDSSGKYEKSFSPSDYNQQFQPTGLCIDSRGRVIVSDYANHHVWIFTPCGDMLHHFGWEGHNPGDLCYPYGIAVDLKGQIIIAESGNHRISVFSNSGTFLKCFGEYGSEPGQFQCPLNLCISPCGSKLIIADEGNRRLQVFDKILFQ